MLDGGKAAVAGNWYLMVGEKAEAGSIKWRLDAALSTLDASGTLEVRLAAVNKHFNERLK